MTAKDSSLGWAKIDAALDRVLDEPAANRMAFIDSEYGDEPTLRRRLMELLDAHESAGDGFMTHPGSADDAPRLHPGERVGPWEIEAFEARGGMGEVYRVRRADGQYEQVAALKLITSTDADAGERFLNERQILARLQHANIAQLLDGGLTDGGRPYMAMEFLEGQTITSWCHGRSLHERIEMFLQAARAVQFAHQHAIIHRDIKPNNVIVTTDGRVKLLDFGIAKDQVVADANMTVGLATPNYAAPEQLHGGVVSTAIDVYALGALLYTMLAGRPPLDMANLHIAEVLQKLRDETPTPPSAGAELPIPADLDAICLQALRKRPEERYGSATEMIADVEAFQAHRPVKARGNDWRYWLRCYVRRNAVVLGATGVIIASLIAALLSVSWHAQRVADERDIAQRDTARLASLRDAVLQIFHAAADDAGEQPLTANELFARSAEKISTEYGDDPATAAGLLQMLGELRFYIGDYGAATELLERALALPSEQVGEEIIADARYDLAQIAFAQGRVDDARTLFEQATVTWSARPFRYAPKLIWSASLASQLSRHDGDSQRAIRQLQQAAERAEALWGRNHPETGVVLNNLAVAHYYANDLAGAIAACERAWAVWQATGRSGSVDALTLLSNWGLFLLRDGDLIAGETRLGEALDLHTQLYGPSAGQATLMKNLGLAHISNGRMDDGLTLIDQAIWMAENYVGAGSPLHVSSLCQLGHIEADHSRLDDAENHVRTALDVLGQGETRWHGYCHAVLGEILSRRQAFKAAHVQLAQGIEILTARGTAALIYLADAHLFTARLHLREGDFEAADTAYAEAATLKTQARSHEHHETLLIQIERGLARARRGQADAASALAMPALAGLRDRLGADHPLVQQQTRKLEALQELAP